MLEGKNVNLRVEEKEDLPLVAEWLNTPDALGEHEGFTQKFQVRVGEALR